MLRRHEFECEQKYIHLICISNSSCYMYMEQASLSLTLPCISPTASNGSAELVEVSISSRPVSRRALTDREMTISPPDTDPGAGSSHSVVGNVVHMHCITNAVESNSLN